MSINLELPIYYHNGKKNMLIGMNTYERMHYHPKNKMKQWFYQIVRSQLNNSQHPIDGQYSVHFKLYFRNKKCDASNIIEAVEKMALDALQNYRMLEEDSVLYYVSSSWEVCGQDTDNPRVELSVASKDTA